MTNHFYVDASALVKRYVVESGTPLVNHLFQNVPAGHLICLTLGTLEAVAVFVRKKNASLLSPKEFFQALANLKSEIIDNADITKIMATDSLVNAAIPLLEKHSINATDAVILRSALDLAAHFRLTGHDLVLVTSDQRLMKAGQAEGLMTFDPETQSQATLDAQVQP